MLESISIKRFRSLKEIRIEDIKQFNLIVGKNNSGKTNIIEMLYQAINPGNAALLGKLHLWKGLDIIDPEIWKTVFYKLDLSEKIEMISKLVNPSRERVLTISPILNTDLIDIEKKTLNHKEDNVTVKDSTSMEPISIKGLSLELYYIENEEKSDFFHSTIINEKLDIDPVRDRGKIFNPFKVNNDDRYKCLSRGKIINPETILLDIWKRFKKIAIRKKKQSIVEILKEFDSNLVDLELIGKTIYADLNYDEKVPISIMGYGFLKTLALLTDIRNEENFILVIDEIENGLHHTNLRIMWKAIFKAAQQMNNQIIATTHSFECIKAFVDTHPGDDDNLRLFRIERKEDDSYEVTKYNKEDISVFLESNWEIR